VIQSASSISTNVQSRA